MFNKCSCLPCHSFILNYFCDNPIGPCSNPIISCVYSIVSCVNPIESWMNLSFILENCFVECPKKCQNSYCDIVEGVVEGGRCPNWKYGIKGSRNNRNTWLAHGLFRKLVFAVLDFFVRQLSAWHTLSYFVAWKQELNYNKSH